MALCAPGSVATAEDPTAIATIQSATTFSDQPIKYLFKTEGAGGQVSNTIRMLLLYVRRMMRRNATKNVYTTDHNSRNKTSKYLTRCFNILEHVAPWWWVGYLFNDKGVLVCIIPHNKSCFKQSNSPYFISDTGVIIFMVCWPIAGSMYWGTCGKGLTISMYYLVHTAMLKAQCGALLWQ